jgi:enamine deaminase RidA (YjgF/YER057c/UK114 family)
VSVYDKLSAIGVSLSPVTPSVALFLPFVRTGNLIFVSGHIARRNGQPWVGQLGQQISVTDGQKAARAIAIDLLGALQAATSDLNTITRIVKLLVLVNSTATFTEPHAPPGLTAHRVEIRAVPNRIAGSAAEKRRETRSARFCHHFLHRGQRFDARGSPDRSEGIHVSKRGDPRVEARGAS